MDKNMKILIVDDFSTVRQIMKNLLRDFGFVNTVKADDGQSGLAKLQCGGIDLSVTDWKMPGYDRARIIESRPGGCEPEPLAVSTVTAEAKRE